MTGASRSSLDFVSLNTGPVLSGTMENGEIPRRCDSWITLLA